MTSLLQLSPLAEEEHQMLNVIADCGNSLLELINDVLELSKIEAGSMELEYRPVVLRDLVHSIVNMFMVAASDKQLTIEAMLDDRLPVDILTDSTKLKRVLVNLVGNAIKFTHQGGVRIECKLVADDGYAGGNDSGNADDHASSTSTSTTTTISTDSTTSTKVRMEFSVADSGIGISSEGQDRLFKPFSQVDSSVRFVFLCWTGSVVLLTVWLCVCCVYICVCVPC